MRPGLYYTTGALISVALAWISLRSVQSPMLANVLFTLFLWIGISLALVAVAYLQNKATLLRKNKDGRIPAAIRWLFIPYFIGCNLYNRWARQQEQCPPLQQIENHLFLGARLRASEISLLKDHHIDAVLDVTAEFDALDWSLINTPVDYLNVPVLDHGVPSADQIKQSINWIDQKISSGKNVLVHCALGRQRSAMIVAGYLLAAGHSDSVTSVIQTLKQQRTQVGLTRRQEALLENEYASGRLKLLKEAWIIANPVSGGGKWPQHKDDIIERLSPYFSLQILETTPETGAGALAEQALKKNARLVICCGGDGSVTEVASHLINTETAMAIIPMGTANALSHVYFGISSKITPIDVACDNIIGGNVQHIDAAYCNDQPMLLMVGLGFEQEMIELADREAKNQLGQLAYIKGLMHACSQNHIHTLQIAIDNQPETTLETSSLIVANAAPLTSLLALGSGEPDIADGLLDITWLEPGETASDNYINLLELAYTGLTEHSLNIGNQHTTAEQIKIRGEGPLKYVIDGEVFEADSLDIRILPKAIKMVLPETSPAISSPVEVTDAETSDTESPLSSSAA